MIVHNIYTTFTHNPAISVSYLVDVKMKLVQNYTYISQNDDVHVTNLNLILIMEQTMECGCGEWVKEGSSLIN